jgi:isoleucyl-tRNA synthetase
MADWRSTLNLPATSFPMKADLAAREPEFISYWDEIGIYGRIREARADAEIYILHDGPPYANGIIHMGHALNKVLKDFVVKAKTMEGYDAPYVPGWDCHGQPIEHEIVKAIKAAGEDVPAEEVRRRCRAFAEEFVEKQRVDFIRLGVFGDWYNPYLTMQPAYEGVVLGTFRKMAADGRIYRGLKPVHWCTYCETALADAELDYKDIKSPSITLRFKVIKGLDDLKAKGDVYFLVWTTTPWTLPANLACCVGAGFEYDAYETPDGVYVLASLLGPVVMEQLGIKEYERVARFTGGELEGVVLSHPFIDRESPVITADIVNLEQGTGVVHTAPGHGAEDFMVGQEKGLAILSPLDNQGRFTSEVPEYEGMHVHDADPLIVEMLREKGVLLGYEESEHSYPHCWRCGSPLIFRATDQWFVDVNARNLRKEALKAVREVEWVPRWGQQRINGMLENRPDWCVSRQRYWGVPITALYCKKCGIAHYPDEFLEKVVRRVEKEGIEYWYTTSVEELAEGAVCAGCGGTEFAKSLDVLDVWFESGSSHLAVLDRGKWPRHRWPSDMYLEGSDQHRGWFQLSLLVALSVKDAAPYRTVLTHGFILDDEGKAMHKSAGNAIPPQDIISKYGADILRLWVASEDYRTDIKVSFDLIRQVSESYRRIRNTARFLLGNLSGFDPTKDTVPEDEWTDVDRYAYRRLARTVNEVYEAFGRYEFHVVYHTIHNFCAVDMSPFYLDVMKDRLYAESADDRYRKTTQTVFYYTARNLAKLLAPIIPFTSEEIWRELPKRSGDPESVHLALWEKLDVPEEPDDLEARFDRFLSVRDVALKAMELAREEKVIGHPLEAAVTLYSEGDLYDSLEGFAGELATYLITSEANLVKGSAPEGAFVSDKEPGIAVVVEPAGGDKCERCWKRSTTVGKDDKYPDLCNRCVDVVKKLGDSV